jgi:hypothetical protein
MAEGSERKDYLKLIMKNPKIAIVTSFGVPLTGLMWQKITDIVETDVLLLVMGLVVFIIVMILTITQSIMQTSLQEEFYSKIGILETFIESSGTGWISTNEELSFVENTAEDITVVTTDLKNDIYDENISQAVENNLAAGKKYVYILPKVTETFGLIEEYKRRHDFKNEQIKVIFVEEDEFFFLNEVVVFDLFNKKPIKAYLVFPSDTHPLQIKLDARHTSKIVGIIKNIIRRKESVLLIDDSDDDDIMTIINSGEKK